MAQWGLTLILTPEEQELLLSPEGADLVSKLSLKLPSRTPPTSDIPIADITLSVPSPIIAAAIANGTTILDLQAIDAAGAAVPGATYTIITNAKFGTSGVHLTRATAGGALTPAVAESVTVQASATGYASFTKTINVNVYDVPGSISLSGAPGASGQTGQIFSNATAGTSVGTLNTAPASGGTIASPLTYTRITNTDWGIGTGGSTLVYSGGTLVDPEVVVVRVTDNLGVTHDETLTISVEAPAVLPTAARFQKPTKPTKFIAICWNLAGPQPTDTAPTGCREGGAGTWIVKSNQGDPAKDCPLIHDHTYPTRDEIRRAMITFGYATEGYRMRPGTLADPYGLVGGFPDGWEGDYHVIIDKIVQDATTVEFICFEGTGYTDEGLGPTGVKLWGKPRCQFEHSSNFEVADQCFLDLQNGTHGQSRYILEGFRHARSRETEAATVIKVMNVPFATTEAECILPASCWNGNGLFLNQTASQIYVDHVEVAGSYGHGLHSTKRLRAMRSNGVVQILNSIFRNNGNKNTEHNTYLGDLKNALLAHSMFVAPCGHNNKWDNEQRWEETRNSIRGYREDFIKYARTTNLKVFKGTSPVYVSTSVTSFDAPLRTIPLTPPHRITVYAFYDDVDTLNGNATLVPSFEATGTPITVLTSGTASAGQTVRTFNGGVKSVDKDKHTLAAFFDFNPADGGKQVRIPGRGFGPNRIDTQGGGISVDNPNQDYAVWNNLIKAFHYSGSTTADVYTQGRFQDGDLRHHKHPDYTYQDPSFTDEISMSTVLGSTTGGQPNPPKTYFGFIGQGNSPPVYRLEKCDYMFSAMFGGIAPDGGSLPGFPFLAGPTVFDCDIRCDSGYIHSTTMTITTKIKTWTSGSVTCTVTIADPIPVGQTITGSAATNNAPGNPVVFKLHTDQWDRPRITTGSQRDAFDRTAPNYYPYMVTTPGTSPFGHTRVLDFSKAEPSVTGLPYGIPMGRIYGNLMIPQLQPDLVGRVTYDPGLIHRNLNACHSTRISSDLADYAGRLARGPLQPSDGTAWAIDANAGSFDWRLKQTTATGGQIFFTDGRNGFGWGGADWIRFDTTVLYENGICQSHMPVNARYEGYANVGDDSADQTLYNANDALPDIRVIPQNNTSVVDNNGCVQLTTADKNKFPSCVSTGSEFAVIGPYGSTGGTAAIMAGGAGPWDRCRIRVTSGAAPQVGNLILPEVDSQMGVGEMTHNAVISGLTPLNATDYDIIFDPPLPQIGDVDELFGTVEEGHEYGLSVNVSTSTDGGRGVFMPRALQPLPAWALVRPQDIPD